MFSYVWLLDYLILLKAKYDELMSLVSPVFHTEVTVSIGFKVGTFSYKLTMCALLIL